MTIPEFNIWLKKNTERIPEEVVFPTANQLIEQISSRVVDTGRSSNRNLFSYYSAPYLKKKKKRIPGASFKNFYFFGDMWKSFGIKDREDTPGKTVIICRMDNDSRGKVTNQGLLEIHSDHENKELIAPNDQEIELARKYFNEKLQELYVS